MLTDFGAKRRYAAIEYIGDDNLPENYKFPETFDHIVDETREVIGLIKEVQKKSDQFMNEMEDEEEMEGEEDEMESGDEDMSPEEIQAKIEELQSMLKSKKSDVKMPF